MSGLTTYFKIPRAFSPFIESYPHHNSIEALKLNSMCVMVHAKRKVKADISKRDKIGKNGEPEIAEDNVVWEDYAWIEDPPHIVDTDKFKATIYDPSFDFVSTREAWYRMYDFKDVLRYSLNDALNLVVSTGTVGPWKDHKDKKIFTSSGNGIPQELINKFNDDCAEALRKKGLEIET